MPNKRNLPLSATPATQFATITYPHSTGNPVNGDIFTPTEAAAFLRISERKLLNAVRGGRIPGKKVDGQWRFSRGALLDHIESSV